MRRGRRMLLAVVALAAAAGAITTFTAFSTASEGPIGATLESLATSIRSFESYVRERANAPARRAGLRWFDEYRSNVAWLRHPDRILLGAYSDIGRETLQGVRDLERTIETTLPLVQVYTAWGDRAEHRFPQRIATTIWNMGSVPVITWEPWLAVFDSVQHPHLPLRDTRDGHGLAAVASGTYDFYIDAWATAAAKFGHPLFLRFAHEMNDPYRYPWGPQNNTKEEFIAAWRHVVDRFRLAGAHNVIWVWSPHVSYQYWDLYYPGEDFTDWVATGVLNYGPIAYWSRWWTFDDIFTSKSGRLAEFGKPVMIAELGSLNVGGDRLEWYEGALKDLPRRHPSVRAVIFFESTNDRTVTYQNVDWSIRSDAALASRVREIVRAW